jgi:putative transposase/transposase-like zinc-binding protein
LPPPEACLAPGPSQSLLDIADIFRVHGEAYRTSHVLTPEQAKAMRAIVACRTAALGGHLDTCDSCGFERPAYNSCRNRHCPKCQGSAQAAWVEKHVARVLPTHYFHVVFTLPAELRPLVHRNRRLLFELLFETASQTLLTLAQDRLGATLGLTAVLHTWTRDLSFHPHLHTIVTGGGLAQDECSWAAAHEEYLFPYLVLSRLFRGKFMAGLVHAYRHRGLDLGGDGEGLAAPDVFDAFKDRLYRKDWVVYQKPPFRGPRDVYRYLGRYTHRIAISNHRLLSFDERGVCFRTKHGKTATLNGEEFVRRFLLHVLPRRFVKIPALRPDGRQEQSPTRTCLHSAPGGGSGCTRGTVADRRPELAGRCNPGRPEPRAGPPLRQPLPGLPHRHPRLAAASGGIGAASTETPAVMTPTATRNRALAAHGRSLAFHPPVRALRSALALLAVPMPPLDQASRDGTDTLPSALLWSHRFPSP